MPPPIATRAVGERRRGGMEEAFEREHRERENVPMLNAKRLAQLDDGYAGPALVPLGIPEASDIRAAS
jgi:hypothetical protein